MFKKLATLFKSKAYLAEEQEYQKDLAAIKQAVKDGKGKSFKEQESLLPFTENKFYPIIGETIYASTNIPYTLLIYAKAKPPVKQIIDSTEEDGRWEVIFFKERVSGGKTVVKAKDTKLNKEFSFSEDIPLNYTVYKDEDDIFTRSESGLLFNVFLRLRNRQEGKNRQAKRQALVELYND